MEITRDSALQIVLSVLQELGEDLGIDKLQEADESTRLFGARSHLDSMNLVNLIAEIEEQLSDEFEIEITLANQSAMSRTASPFRRVSTCVDYIMELVGKNNS